MAQLNETYKCQICGNVVTVIHAGVGKLVCCGQAMQLMVSQNKGQGAEKHLPIIQQTSNGYVVKIGSISHPMESEHYIEWIELLADGKSYRQYCRLGSPAKAEFCLVAPKVQVRAYCNMHGIWQSHN